MRNAFIFVSLFLNMLVTKAVYSDIASDLPGKVLLQYCKQVDNAAHASPPTEEQIGDALEQVFEATSCVGIVSGALAGWELVASESKGSLPFELPEHVNEFKIIRGLVEYLESHPEHLDSPSIVVLWSMLIEQFPAKK